ncbi:MAG: hypothetical protein FWF55_04280, partial [Treponema sp.]|nr:hypothetical protein [Treponema sp.]
GGYNTRCFHALIFLIVIAIPSHAQEPLWYDEFYLETSVQNYFTPKILEGLIKPKPGFRGSVGYELKRFRFTVESGVTFIDGTNPLVTDITLAPLLFKIGYALPIRLGFGVQADLGAGVLFSRVSRYETALDLVLKNKREDSVQSPLSTARLYGTWSPWNYLKLYAGGGADIVFENDGPISLLLIEAGISFKPLARKDTFTILLR